MKVVRMSALHINHLNPPRNILGRHCGTNRQVTSSIPDGIIEIFQRHNPSGHTMALGSTQLLTEMSTLCIFWW